LRRSWECKLIESDSDLITFVGEFEEDVKHEQLGLIRRGTISYEYYWRDRWYNVFRFHELGGELRNFYCNVGMPPRFENNLLEYVDLDIDILVQKDFSIEILDMDDFEENAVKYQYPEDVRKKAYQSLDDLKSMIERREFPFDYSPGAGM
jgi:protein associated with RNAse G/E